MSTKKEELLKYTSKMKIKDLVKSEYTTFTATGVINGPLLKGVIIGADTIKNIALTVSVQQVFTKLEKSEQISLSRFRYPLGGGITPPEPARGSTITAAIFEAS